MTPPPAHHSRSNATLWMWLLTATGLLLGACGRPATSEDKPAPTLVHTVVATAGPGAAAIIASGVIAAADEAKLSFKVGGVIQRIRVREGEAVTAGQVLAELIPTEINAQLAQARQLRDKAQRDVERGERLYADQVIALSQLEDLRTQAHVAAAQLQAAAFNQGYARITASSAGTVLRKLAQAHELVAPAQPILILGARDKGFVVRAALADRDVVQLKVGDTAEVKIDAFAEQQFVARVSEIGGAARIENGLFPIEVQLQQIPANLVSGLVAQLRIQPQSAHQTSLLYVPTGAVIAGIGKRASLYVFEQGIAKRREVEVAFFTRDHLAIASGIQAGEQIITDGALYLHDNEPVTVQASPAP